MHRLFLAVAATLLITTGCVTQKPTTSTSLEPKIRAKVQKGVIEPGFTPEMVYVALGKPTEPPESLADATTNGTWVYHDFHRNEGDIVKPGFRRHAVFDAAKNSDVIKTEPIAPEVLRTLRAHSLHVTFRDGRVVEIQRVAGISADQTAASSRPGANR
jgi:hypothetical protein